MNQTESSAHQYPAAMVNITNRCTLNFIDLPGPIGCKKVAIFSVQKSQVISTL